MYKQCHEQNVAVELSYCTFMKSGNVHSNEMSGGHVRRYSNTKATNAFFQSNLSKRMATNKIFLKKSNEDLNLSLLSEDLYIPGISSITFYNPSERRY